jgi:hypothetical protein
MTRWYKALDVMTVTCLVYVFTRGGYGPMVCLLAIAAMEVVDVACKWLYPREAAS